MFLLVIFCSYSDESDEEFDHEPEYMMNKLGLAESALYEVINDHQTEIKVGRFVLFC